MAGKEEADAKVEHVVLIVPGIRDFGKWTKVVGAQIKAALPDVVVTRANIGFFGLLQFLLPLPILRSWALVRIMVRIRELRHRYKNAEISFIAHSFGSHCIANILLSEFDVKARFIIFCGSVVPRDFPFNRFHERFRDVVLNDVGTADPWPAAAEAIAFGCGSIGTFGYGDSAYVTDRFHNDAGHGYFFEGNFASQYWVPFLRDGTITPGAETPASAPRYIDIIGRIHIKQILAVILLLIGLTIALKILYPAHSFYANAATPSRSAQVDAEGLVSLYPWRSIVQRYTDEARLICPLGGALCPPEPIQRFLWGREFKTALQYDDDLLKVSSCKPYDPAQEMTDPFAAIVDFTSAFPQCMSQSKDLANFRWLPSKGQGRLETSSDGDTLYCGCSASAVDAFSR
jgi:hypothetical protein